MILLEAAVAAWTWRVTISAAVAGNAEPGNVVEDCGAIYIRSLDATAAGPDAVHLAACVSTAVRVPSAGKGSEFVLMTG
jgi:hypothetical protein